MTRLTRHHTEIRVPRSFLLGLWIMIMSVIPVVTQAGVLEETFGGGYGLIDGEAVVRTTETSRRVGSITASSTLRQTFGEGYAFLDQVPLALTLSTPTLMTEDGKNNAPANFLKAPRISAFDSLLRDGYGVLVPSSQSKFPELFTYDRYH